MRNAYSLLGNIFVCVATLFVANLYAQDAAPASPNAEVPATKVTEAKPAAVKKTEAEGAQPAKKMVQDATISLQTTITGNQEQPRVLYILPWQSPTTTDVDFESLDNEQKAVFGHVEREELRRELESADAIQ
ncbi:MAG: hypothetical protein ABW044_03560 [Cellvibrio sp.]